jgi:hypothetical protein
MEKTPNSNAPTLKLVNGPAGRDYLLFARNGLIQIAMNGSVILSPSWLELTT